jgi:hypothetical protein
VAALITENIELRSALVDAITLAAAVWDEGHPILQRARYALKSASLRPAK